MRFRQQQRFERPRGPVRHNRQPVLGFYDRTTAVRQFSLDVINEHWRALFGEVRFLQAIFTFGFVRQKAVGPNLSVWVRVRAPHRCAFILKYLHPRVGFP